MDDDQVVEIAKTIKNTNEKLIKALNDFKIPDKLKELDPFKNLDNINNLVKEKVLENRKL